MHNDKLLSLLSCGLQASWCCLHCHAGWCPLGKTRFPAGRWRRLCPGRPRVDSCTWTPTGSLSHSRRWHRSARCASRCPMNFCPSGETWRVNPPLRRPGPKLCTQDPRCWATTSPEQVSLHLEWRENMNTTILFLMAGFVSWKKRKKGTSGAIKERMKLSSILSGYVVPQRKLPIPCRTGNTRN